MLEHEAQLPAPEQCHLGPVQQMGIASADDDLARRRLIDGGDQVQQRRFAAAGWAHDPDELSFFNREVNVVQRLERHFAFVDFG